MNIEKKVLNVLKKHVKSNFKRVLKLDLPEVLADIEALKYNTFNENYFVYINGINAIKYCKQCGKKSSFNKGDYTNFCSKKCVAIYNGSNVDHSYSYEQVKALFEQENYTLLSTEYINCREYLEYICPNNHKHSITFNNWKLGHRCPKCLNSGTSRFEKEVLDFVVSLDPLMSVNSNMTTLLEGRKEIDIYIPSLMLGIECNGLYWHSEISGNKDKNYHLIKSKEAENKGIRLIHIFESEWNYKQDIVKSILSNIISLSKKVIYARKCKIKSISSKEASDFYNINHIQGKGVGSKLNYALINDGNIVAVMTFIKARFNRNHSYEISRFANLLNINVIGGASRLLKAFETEYDTGSIVSYSDRRYFNGKIYEKLGFTFSHYSRPNYFYFSDNDRTLKNRTRYQKHKLEGILDNFNPNISEWENMKLNNFDRIWDCGNSVWIKER